MKEFWQKLTDRERLLVTVAGVLVGLFIIALAVVRPLIAMQENSRRNLAAAEEEYDHIQSLAGEYHRLESAVTKNEATTQNDQPKRVLIAIAARETGVVVTRIQPTEKGGLTLWIDSVSSIAFYTWLKQLEGQHRLSPDQVSLQKSSDGTLRAQVQFAGAG